MGSRRATELHPLTFEPRIPLVRAEQVVDFAAHQTEIVDRRANVEASVMPFVKRMVVLAANFGGIAPIGVQREMQALMARALMRTAEFGYKQARREIRLLRGERNVPPAVALAYEIPDAGRHARRARQGLPGVEENVNERAGQVTQGVLEEMRKRITSNNLTDALNAIPLIQRFVHRNVLELVGETLNLGRIAGALSFGQQPGPVRAAPAYGPPQFAFRSEQLDKNTCDACTQLHGLIAQIDTAEFYAETPPAGCFGGGRCRGIWVFGDERDQFAAAVPSPSPPQAGKWAWDDNETRYPIEPDAVIPGGSKAWEQALTVEERDAIRGYTGGGYQPMNRILREPLNYAESDDLRIAPIRRALSRAPEADVTVWRGIQLDLTGPRIGGDVLERTADAAEQRFQVGQILTFNGLQSCSFDLAPALNAASSQQGRLPGVLFEIRAKSGAFIRGESQYDDEAEWLIDHGHRFRVRKILRRGSVEVNEYGDKEFRTIVQLEEL